jgi:iron complex outermembrane receptor protein
MDGEEFWIAPRDPTLGRGIFNISITQMSGSRIMKLLPSRISSAAKDLFRHSFYVASQSLMQSYDWYHLLKTYNGDIPNGTADQYWTRSIDQGLNKTDSRIVNVAAYVQARFAHDRIGFIPAFSGNIGVRVFHDSLRASGLLRTPNAQNLALSEADSTAYFNATQGVPGGSYPTLYAFKEAYSMQTRTTATRAFCLRSTSSSTYPTSSSFVVRRPSRLPRRISMTFARAVSSRPGRFPTRPIRWRPGFSRVLPPAIRAQI